jgi:hypothetical protein
MESQHAKGTALCVHSDVFPGSWDLSLTIEICPVRVESIRVIAVIAACEHAVEVHVTTNIAETAVGDEVLAFCHASSACKWMGM